nr:MAG TPA_asm: hypothetical protein [Caudoviricetes sp.]DAV63814.1 MAG TPA: hypothetical protein [Caudoviricetes sp.]
MKIFLFFLKKYLTFYRNGIKMYLTKKQRRNMKWI